MPLTWPAVAVVLVVRAALATSFGPSPSCSPSLLSSLHPPPHSFIDGGNCFALHNSTHQDWGIVLGSPTQGMTQLAQDLAADLAAVSGIVLPVKDGARSKITLKLDPAVTTAAIRPTAAAAAAAAGPMWEDEASNFIFGPVFCLRLIIKQRP